MWTKKALYDLIKTKLRDYQLIVVSNREPYIRRQAGDQNDCRQMGENGFQHVRQNFLLTRHVKDYMLVMMALEHRDEDVVHLI